MTDREKQIEIAVKNPEQVVETPEEIAERDKLRNLYLNSNYDGSAVSHYEAGWKAAKAYYDVHG